MKTVKRCGSHHDRLGPANGTFGGPRMLKLVLFGVATALVGCRRADTQANVSKTTAAAQSSPEPTPEPKAGAKGVDANVASVGDLPPNAKRRRDAHRKSGRLPPCNASNAARPQAWGQSSPMGAGHEFTCKEAEPERLLTRWGYEIGWLALPTDDATAVAKALDLSVTPTSWNQGVAEANYGVTTFITPPIEGWTLVVAGWILEADAERLETLVVRLSEEFGEAQAFATSSYFEHHGLVLAQTNALRRSFVYEGEKRGIVRNEGSPLSEEAEIDRTHFSTSIDPDGKVTHHPIVVMTPNGSIQSMDPLPNDIWTENVVTRLAARLSVDPTALSRADVPDARGWSGPTKNLE